jgi:hypothetical protein
VRTTVTLDPDTHAFVRRLMREGGLTFKQALNDAIRAGFGPQWSPAPPELPTFPMGPPKVDLTKALQLAGSLEDEALLRKLAESR